MTNAGNLQCQKIVHYGRGSSSTNWDDVVDESLKQAEQHSLQSMALPAIGTGEWNGRDIQVSGTGGGIQKRLQSMAPPAIVTGEWHGRGTGGTYR